MVQFYSSKRPYDFGYMFCRVLYNINSTAEDFRVIYVDEEISNINIDWINNTELVEEHIIASELSTSNILI